VLHVHGARLRLRVECGSGTYVRSLVRDLGERLGCPVEIQNDAGLAGYAEWTAGAGRGTAHFVFITVSTGIGGALIIDGQLYDGGAGSGG